MKDVSSFSKFRALHFTTYLQIYLVNGNNMVLLVMLYEPFYVGLSQQDKLSIFSCTKFFLRTEICQKISYKLESLFDYSNPHRDSLTSYTDQ